MRDFIHIYESAKTAKIEDVLAGKYVVLKEKRTGTLYYSNGIFEWARHDWNYDGDIYARKVATVYKDLHYRRFLEKYEIDELFDIIKY